MFKDNIKSLREMHHLTQEEFAEKIAVSRTAVSKWETGKSYPSLDSLKMISDLFAVSIDELISNYDVTNKKALDKKKMREYVLSIISILLALSLIVGWAFFKKTEVMRYTADEAMMYGFKGLSHEIKMGLEELVDLNQDGRIDDVAFAKLCQDLERDIFYSTESIASFDYGVATGYNDYDLIDFYCYINNVAIISNNFYNMSEDEIKAVYDSFYKVCVSFDDFDWNLKRTDSYIGTDLTAYNFREDKQVRHHLSELKAMIEKEEQLLEPYVERALAHNN